MSKTAQTAVASEELPTPRNIQLTVEEMLRLENLELKRKAAQDAFNALSATHRTLVADIEQRLGIKSLKSYALDTTTGEGVLVPTRVPAIPEVN